MDKFKFSPSFLLPSVLLVDEDVHAVEEDKGEVVVGARVENLNLPIYCDWRIVGSCEIQCAIVRTFMKPMM